MLGPQLVGLLAREIQHLMRESNDLRIQDGIRIVGWHCLEVSLVTAAVLRRLGFKTSTVPGVAIFYNRPHIESLRTERNVVRAHFWCEVIGLGVVDFSPDLSLVRADWTPVDFSYVFAGRVIAPQSWLFRRTELLGRLNGPAAIAAQDTWFSRQHERRAAIYLPLRESRDPEAQVDAQTLYLESKILSKLEITLCSTQSDGIVKERLVTHLCALVNEKTESLSHMPRREAWQSLLADVNYPGDCRTERGTIVGPRCETDGP
jgi:hypothetical protein